jgi:hypothetical protein
VTVPVDRPEQISPPAPRPAPQNPPPPLQPVDERAAIEQTLRAYEAAWASRDPNSLSRLQTLSGDGFAAVRNSMDSAREIEVSVQVQNVALADDSRHATVTARVRRRFVPKSAARTSDIVANNVFTMEKRGEMWVIVALR